METEKIAETADALVASFAEFSSCAVAFSGGVDSAVVAQAAHLALADRATAVTAISPSLSRREREVAEQVARSIGIRHRCVQTHEMDNGAYRANRGDRCYYCKTTLYETMKTVLQFADGDVVANGTNADDLHDYRPGLQAATEHQIWSPLAELQLGKQEVRQLARYWGLAVADKPASPCLASRIAYGTEVTETRLHRIDAAEAVIRDAGFEVVRVRCLANDAARIEVEPTQVDSFRDVFERLSLEQRLMALGFTEVAIEPEGYRSGRLNDDLVPLSLPTSSPRNSARQSRRAGQ